MAEGGGLLNRYTLLKAYRGFESLRLRQNPAPVLPSLSGDASDLPQINRASGTTVTVVPRAARLRMAFSEGA